MTILVTEAEFAFVRPLAAYHAFVDVAGARHVVGMQQTLPGVDMRLDLVFRVAEHLLPCRGVHDGARLQVPVPYPLLGPGEGQREPLLALTQRRLRALPFGKIKVGADDSHDRAARAR